MHETKSATNSELIHKNWGVSVYLFESGSDFVVQVKPDASGGIVDRQWTVSMSKANPLERQAITTQIKKNVRDAINSIDIDRSIKNDDKRSVLIYTIGQIIENISS